MRVRVSQLKFTSKSCLLSYTASNIEKHCNKHTMNFDLKAYNKAPEEKAIEISFTRKYGEI